MEACPAHCPAQTQGLHYKRSYKDLCYRMTPAPLTIPTLTLGVTGMGTVSNTDLVYIHLKGREPGIFHVLAHFPNACNHQGWARPKSRPEIQSGLCLPCGWQGPRDVSHHLLPLRVHISRKWTGNTGTLISCSLNAQIP